MFKILILWSLFIASSLILPCSALAQENFQVVKGDISAACYSLGAIYEPHLPEKSKEKYEYFYELRIVNSGQDELKFPTYAYVITKFDKKTTKPVTELTLGYGCTIGPPNCVVSYEDGGSRNILDIISLNQDLTQNMVNIRSRGYHEDAELPYLIIMPTLSRVVYKTRWNENSSSVKYLTADKIPPNGFDVWKFKSCN